MECNRGHQNYARISTTRNSGITNVTLKSGARGLLCFVTVEHCVRSSCGVATRELQDLVYRQLAPPGTATLAAAPARAQHHQTRRSDPVLRFRYFRADLQRPPHPP
ncbi:MAG: hypothetical protein FWD68_12895 [Alphaproteobacteria bacterium]|nr:hypothetical protein [Alphaproteobacteria bacterium]